MKKIFKTIGILLIAIILIFFALIFEESIRLYKNSNAIPFIVTDKTKYCVECINVGEEIEVEYYSIGYSVKMRYYKTEKSHGDLAFINVTEKKFMLFNRYMLWGWIS